MQARCLNLRGIVWKAFATVKCLLCNFLTIVVGRPFTSLRESLAGLASREKYGRGPTGMGLTGPNKKAENPLRGFRPVVLRILISQMESARGQPGSGPLDPGRQMSVCRVPADVPTANGRYAVAGACPCSCTWPEWQFRLPASRTPIAQCSVLTFSSLVADALPLDRMVVGSKATSFVHKLILLDCWFAAQTAPDTTRWML